MLQRGSLVAKGESWGGPPLEHIGGINELVIRTGYIAEAAECTVTFWLIGKFLIADDHDNPCGGQGADFYGVFRKLRKRRD
jgi:hypothetical protein